MKRRLPLLLGVMGLFSSSAHAQLRTVDEAEHLSKTTGLPILAIVSSDT